jgi:integrase
LNWEDVDLDGSKLYPKVVQSLLGHSSIAQTMDTYSHLMEGMGGDAVDGLEDAFG